MSRDQRVNDNWAILYAQKLNIDRSVSEVRGFNPGEKAGLHSNPLR